MDDTGDAAVLLNFVFMADVNAVTTLCIGRNAAGDDHAYATPHTLYKIAGQPLKATRCFFQARVHGAHQNAVLQLGPTQVEWRKKQGVAVVVRHEWPYLDETMPRL
jgi:hypothetical protein